MAAFKRRKGPLVPAVIDSTSQGQSFSPDNKKEELNPDRLTRILYEKQNVIDFLKSENNRLENEVSNLNFIVTHFTHCVTGRNYQARLEKVNRLADMDAEDRAFLRQRLMKEEYDKGVKINYLTNLAAKYAKQQTLLKMELSDARRDVSILHIYKDKYAELLKYYQLTHSLPEVRKTLDEKGEYMHLDVDWINSPEKKDEPIDEITRKELRRATFWRVIAVIAVILLAILVAMLLIPAIGKLHIGEWFYNLFNKLGQL